MRYFRNQLTSAFSLFVSSGICAELNIVWRVFGVFRILRPDLVGAMFNHKIVDMNYVSRKGRIWCLNSLYVLKLRFQRAFSFMHERESGKTILPTSDKKYG